MGHWSFEMQAGYYTERRGEEVIAWCEGALTFSGHSSSSVSLVFSHPHSPVECGLVLMLVLMWEASAVGNERQSAVVTQLMELAVHRRLGALVATCVRSLAWEQGDSIGINIIEC
ncbi:hypothetical protein EYF80_026214 [Liparis tanakae]|uniref:Uncharacterized protein n=1 Tax=Liparis tanakae TaxID=230148 RepID=A0A4Z2HFI4_9TELE|nr:hypothetical protein EYF80_026214 [Liparis tanakae]